jgi:hypothetical protein
MASQKNSQISAFGGRPKGLSKEQRDKIEVDDRLAKMSGGRNRQETELYPQVFLRNFEELAKKKAELAKKQIEEKSAPSSRMEEQYTNDVIFMDERSTPEENL